MTTHYRKQPLEIEAIRVTDLRNDKRHRLPAWALNAINNGLILIDRHIAVVTLEGTMRADPDGWIIKGVANEFYPCRADVFEKTYEPVREDDDDLGPLPDWMPPTPPTHTGGRIINRPRHGDLGTK